MFTATVIDRYGNRVPNVKVDFAETGAGNFANGGSSAAGVTDAQGEVKVRATSAANETGDQQIAASLSAADTDCELVAGTPAGAPDGTCVSRAVIHWTGVSQASARNIKRSPAEATNPAGGEQVFTATVTDHNGKPVPGVKVDFAETGAGNFANGGSSAAGVTDAQGELKIKATSAATEAGDQQITASLSAADTDCELLAGTPAGAPEGNCHSRAVAHWTAPPAPGSLDATPERDTKLQGTSHTVEVKAFDAAGAPSAGRQVSFQVVEGPNAAGDLDKDAATPNGFFGRCVTQASGACSQSYSDLAKQFGKDRIVAFQDVNGNAKFDAGTDDAVVATDSVEVAWVSSAEMPNKVAIDMKGCDGDLANPATSWDPQGVPQSVTTDFAKARLVCAVPFGGGKVAFTPITFQLTGKGYFTNSRGENLGPKITVQEPGSQGAAGAGYYSVWLVSPEAGTSTITAGITGFTSTPGTQEWTSARTLKLTPAEATNLAGGEQIVTATVLDAAGKPVQDVTVDFKATGIGHFADGGATASSKTDANGEVQIRATSGRTETGDMKITAAISPTETDCELPAGTPQGAPAGNCSAEAIMHWAVPTGPCKGYLEGSTQPNPASSNGGMVIVGTSANADTLSGTAGDDIICGLGGDDRITGAAGNDLLAGAAGNDIVTGDDGNDRIDGGAGVDTINGVRGNDKLRGRGGSDVMKGGAGKDYLRGDGGNDRINGGTGFDICVPGRGRNSVSGCER